MTLRSPSDDGPVGLGALNLGLRLLPSEGVAVLVTHGDEAGRRDMRALLGVDDATVAEALDDRLSGRLPRW